jgi:hypothetical protein
LENQEIMNVITITFFVVLAILLALLVWSLVPRQTRRTSQDEAQSLEESGRRHATYSGLICQSLSNSDFDFLKSRHSLQLARRVQKERRHVALLYLVEIRSDFDRLLRLARVIAVLSPEVSPLQEFDRLRLSFQFSWRYQLIRAGLSLNAFSIREFANLTGMVSALAVRIEAAMKELGERASLAAELASSLDGRRGVDIA